MIGNPAPGDVIVVRTPQHHWYGRLASRLIRLGEALRDKPNLDNHVAVVHHVDPAGTLWAIGAGPNGVGWTDVSVYDNPFFLSNEAQPKSSLQRDQVCAAAEGLLGVAYDWTAIGMDAVEAVALSRLWRSHPFGTAAPSHIVCSALASWVYQKVGLPAPAAPWRTTTPGDWSEFVLTQGWKATP